MSAEPVMPTVDRAPRALPRGRHALEPEVVRSSQRWRMLEAAGLVAAEKGFARLSVADITREAGVSRKTFYEHFDTKLDCFLQSYETNAEVLLRRTRAAARAADGGWRAGFAAALRAYLGTMELQPRLARTFLIEVLAAGPEAIARREQVHRRFVAILREIHIAGRKRDPALRRRPTFVFEAFVGGANELVYNRIGAGRTDLLALEPQLMELARDLMEGR
jgi:AcrR family transcriptional regulator